MLKKIQSQKGLTLIEMVIVVVMVTTLVLIAVPFLQRAIMQANESSTVSAMRVISQAQNNKSINSGKFVSLAQLQSEGLLDERFKNADLSNNLVKTGGYEYLMTLINPESSASGNYVLSAKPAVSNRIYGSGSKRFGMIKDAVIYFDLENLDDHFTDPSDVVNYLPIGN